MLQDRLDVLDDLINQLLEGAQNDAKGSAGDKHETALSMMHIEQAKLRGKRSEVLESLAYLSRINLEKIHNTVMAGSLVKVNDLNLFIGIALPKITAEGLNVIGVSSDSPMGNHLMGKSVGFGFEINGTKFFLKEISL